MPLDHNVPSLNDPRDKLGLRIGGRCDSWKSRLEAKADRLREAQVSKGERIIWLAKGMLRMLQFAGETNAPPARVF